MKKKINIYGPVLPYRRLPFPSPCRRNRDARWLLYPKYEIKHISIDSRRKKTYLRPNDSLPSFGPVSSSPRQVGAGIRVKFPFHIAFQAREGTVEWWRPE